MASRLGDLLSPLAQREARRLFLAQLISGLGDWAGRLALAVLVFDRSGSVWWTAAVTMVALLPWIGPGQLLSTFADRFGRIRVMVIADLARAALFVVMLAPLPIGALLGVAFLAGLCVPPFTSARGAAIVDVIHPDRYGKTLALFGVASQAELVVGYALGGAVIAAIGARATLAANALTFLASAALIATIRSSAASEQHHTAPIGWSGVRAGTRVWRADALCRRALVLFVGVNMLMVLPEALIVPYGEELGAPNGTVGLLAATIALGTMLAMATGPVSDDHRELLRLGARRTMLFAIVAAAAFVVARTWLPAAAAAALFFSGAVDAVAVPTNQVVGARLPRAGRASAMAVAGGVQYGSQATAIAIGGGLAAMSTSGTVLAGAAMLTVGVTAWSLLRPPAA